MLESGTIDTVLKNKSIIVSYVPLADEADPSSFLTETLKADTYVIPPDRSTDPYEEATKLSGLSTGAVFVPGRHFDAFGTRHGRGGGWYDRFLATIPSSWVRIGFCFEHQLSDDPLIRQPWDEPMDYLVVVGQDTPTLYETNARPGIL